MPKWTEKKINFPQLDEWKHKTACLITTEWGLIQNVGFLLGEPSHDNTETHAKEVVNLKEAMQQEDDENDNAEKRAKSHDCFNSNFSPGKTLLCVKKRSCSLLHLCSGQ